MKIKRVRVILLCIFACIGGQLVAADQFAEPEINPLSDIMSVLMFAQQQRMDERLQNIERLASFSAVAQIATIGQQEVLRQNMMQLFQNQAFLGQAMGVLSQNQAALARNQEAILEGQRSIFLMYRLNAAIFWVICLGITYDFYKDPIHDFFDRMLQKLGLRRSPAIISPT